jgi:hypothetical protein
LVLREIRPVIPDQCMKRDRVIKLRYSDWVPKWQNVVLREVLQCEQALMGLTVMESRLSLCYIFSLSLGRVCVVWFLFVVDDDDDNDDDCDDGVCEDV